MLALEKKTFLTCCSAKNEFLKENKRFEVDYENLGSIDGLFLGYLAMGGLGGRSREVLGLTSTPLLGG